MSCHNKQPAFALRVKLLIDLSSHQQSYLSIKALSCISPKEQHKMYNTYFVFSSLHSQKVRTNVACSIKIRHMLQRLIFR